MTDEAKLKIEDKTIRTARCVRSKIKKKEIGKAKPHGSIKSKKKSTSGQARDAVKLVILNAKKEAVDRKSIQIRNPEQTEIQVLEAENAPNNAINKEIGAKKVKDQIEEAVLRFPHLGEQIFEILDDQSLLKCQKVSRQWKVFITEMKALPIELLQKCTLIPKARLKKSLQKHDIKIVQKLANCAINEHKSMSTHNVPTRAGQAKLVYHMIFKKYLDNMQYFLIELILQNVTDINLTERANQANDLLFLAISNGHFSICKFITENLKDFQKNNPWGQTLIASAYYHGHQDIFRLLKSALQIEKNK